MEVYQLIKYQSFLITLCGVWVVMAAAFNWNIFFDFKQVHYVSELFFNGNRTYTRIFYFILGSFVFSVGGLSIYHYLYGVTNPLLRYFLLDCCTCTNQNERNPIPLLYAIPLSLLVAALMGFLFYRIIKFKELNNYTNAEVIITALIGFLSIGILFYMIFADHI